MSKQNDYDDLTSGVVKRLVELIELYSSQTEFSKATGIPGSTVSAFTKGRIVSPKVSILVQVVRGTGVSWEWLLEGTGPKFNPRKVKVDMNRIRERQIMGKARNGSLSDADLREEEEIKLLQELLEKKMGI